MIKNTIFAVLIRVVLVFRFYYILTVFSVIPVLCHASKNTFSIDSIAEFWQTVDLNSDNSDRIISTKIINSSDSLFVNFLQSKIDLDPTKKQSADLFKGYYLLGTYYSKAFQNDKALAYYDKATIYASTIEQNSFLMLSIAQVKIESSQYFEALEYLRQAKIAVYKKDFFQLQAEILLKEGFCYAQINNPEVASNRFSSAQSIIESSNLDHLQSKLFCYKGLNYLQQNDYINAMASLVQSAEMNKYDSVKSIHAYVLQLFGTIYGRQGNILKANEYFTMSGSIYKQLNNKKGLADINLETILLNSKDSINDQTLPQLQKALDNYENIGNLEGICRTNNAIANYYIHTKQYKKVFSHLMNANKADHRLNNNRLFFLTTFHFAKYYLAVSKYDSALYYANKTFDFNKHENDIDLLISTHKLLADIYDAKGDYKKSISALKMAQEMKESHDLKIYSYELKLLQVELETKRQQSVINTLTQERNNQSIALEKNVKRIEKQNIIIYLIITILFFIVVLTFILFIWLRQKKKVYQKLELRNRQIAQQKEEIEVQQQYLIEINQELEKHSIVARKTDNGIKVMDSLGNIVWINEGYEKMHGYTLEEVQLFHSKNMIGEQSNIEITKLVNVWFGDKQPISYESLTRTKQGQEIWIQTSLTPILDSSGKIFRMIAIDSDITRIKKAENEIMAKNHDIMSSIGYAKRIQEAMMTPFSILTDHFPESFFFHIPKSIVSGDFYWVSKQQDRLIVVCADSTGHGVPGAFMSLIGMSFLNKIVNEKGFVSPSAILNLLRINVINQLHQTSVEMIAGDGLDMSIISIDLKHNFLEYAGAMNPVIILRNSDLMELKPDRMPVGFFDNEDRPFSLSNVNLQPNDQIFMFTDGYYDQFGGSNGSKMKGQKFRSIIRECANKPTPIQKQIIEDQFNKWKGDHQQVDDILILGITIN